MHAVPIDVHCGSQAAILHLQKYGSNKLSPCIFTHSRTQTKNYKKTILSDKGDIATLIKLGYLKEHNKYCNCGIGGI